MQSALIPTIPFRAGPYVVMLLALTLAYGPAVKTAEARHFAAAAGAGGKAKSHTKGKTRPGAKGKPAKGKGKKPMPPTAPTPEEKAEKLMAEGGVAYEEGRYGDALPFFVKARDLIPDASGPHKALGYTLLKLEMLDEAKTAFEEYLTLTTSSAGADEARNALDAIDARVDAKKAADAPAPPDPGPSPVLPVSPADPVKEKGRSPVLAIAGFSWGGLGLATGAVGAVFTIQLLGARSRFGASYESVRDDLEVKAGTTEALHICNDDDFARFTPASQKMLAEARTECGTIDRWRILGPLLLLGGVGVAASGIAVGVIGLVSGGGKKKKSAALPLRVVFAPTPGGGAVIVGGTF